MVGCCSARHCTMAKHLLIIISITRYDPSWCVGSTHSHHGCTVHMASFADFLLIFFLLHCKPIPVMRSGFSLCSISNREKPVFVTGIPANENRFFPVWKYYTGKTLFWPCTGPVRDCSVVTGNNFWLTVEGLAGFDTNLSLNWGWQEKNVNLIILLR